MTHQNLRLGKCWKLFRATLNWLWEKPNISDVGTHQTNNEGETFERGCEALLGVLGIREY